MIELWETAVNSKENEEGSFNQKDEMLTEFQSIKQQGEEKGGRGMEKNDL